MMKTLAATISALCLVGFSASAFAQPIPDNYGTKEKVIDFDKGDNIKGEHDKGAGTLINGEPRRDVSSLVTVKKNFLPEMIKSVEDL